MSMSMMRQAPVIGITADVNQARHCLNRAYAARIEQAGGVPLVLPCVRACVERYLALCDGIVLTGGDDPIMSHWDVPMHPKATPIDPDRQAFELALLDALDAQQHIPVLGICLGMQLMGLHAGGTLDQHLPDTLPTADMHWNGAVHEITGELGQGMIHSHHRQALVDAGRLRVVATAPDGVIEAVRADDRAFYLGVQWHPERTEHDALGLDLFRQLIAAARLSASEAAG